MVQASRYLRLECQGLSRRGGRRCLCIRDAYAHSPNTRDLVGAIIMQRVTSSVDLNIHFGRLLVVNYWRKKGIRGNDDSFKMSWAPACVR